MQDGSSSIGWFDVPHRILRMLVSLGSAPKASFTHLFHVLVTLELTGAESGTGYA